MNIIEHLARTVTPVLLGNAVSANDGRTSLLEKVYAIIVARLADKDVYTKFDNINVDNEDHGFFDRLLPEANYRSTMVQELAKHYSVPEQETQSLIQRAAPLVLNELRGLSGTTSLPSFLTNNLSSLVSVLPAWAYGFIPAGILGLLNINPVHASTTHVQPQTVTTTRTEEHLVATPKEEEGGLMKILLPIIGLLILAALAWALLKSCGKKEEVTAVPVASTTPASVVVASGPSASLLAPTLALATGADGKLSLGGLGTVGNEDLKTKIMSALTGVFGADAGNAVNVNVDPAYDVNMPVADKLGDILNLVKAVPNAGLKVDGNHIMVSAPDAAAADKLVKDIQALSPDFMVMLDSAMPATASTTTSTASVTTTTTTISSTEPSVVFDHGRLSFYFATGKADVAGNAVEKAQEILDAAKQGKVLGVTGYTDSTGNAAANAKLSKERAQAVKAFLVANGVPDAQLKLIKPTDSVGAEGKDQEGRRVDVYIADDNAVPATASVTTTQVTTVASPAK
ncbi:MULTISPECIES: OmpA family protein [unclassified Moraxella]|uniref:OmpA family protein n=1 Tax=unclassified Moraxella TaxID=2685852 RepID=UPI003AF8AA82